jgi:hypothetical protein
MQLDQVKAQLKALVNMIMNHRFHKRRTISSSARLSPVSAGAFSSMETVI